MPLQLVNSKHVLMMKNEKVRKPNKHLCYKRIRVIVNRYTLTNLPELSKLKFSELFRILNSERLSFVAGSLGLVHR